MRRIIFLFVASMFAFFGCQEVTAPNQGGELRFFTGNVKSVQFVGTSGVASFSSQGLSKVGTMTTIEMYGPDVDTSHVIMIMTTPQNVTNTISYDLGQAVNFFAGQGVSSVFTFLQGEDYHVTFKVDGGIGQALEIEFLDENDTPFRPHHVVKAGADDPNGGQAWEFTPQKMNDGNIKFYQGGDNTNKLHQIVLMLRMTSSVIQEYPDLVDKLPDFSMAYPPSIQLNLSDYIAFGGNSSPNLKFTMRVVEIDGELIAYYSFYALETSNTTYGDFVRFFSASVPVRPLLGGFIAEVVNGEVQTSVELLRAFNRDTGNNNVEYVLIWGWMNNSLNVGEGNLGIVLHGTGNGGGDDFTLDCDNSEYRVFDDGDTTRVKWTPELDRLHAMLWSFDYDHARLLCKLGVKVRYSSDPNDSTQNHEDHYQTLEILSSNGDTTIVATSQTYIDPGSGKEGYWVFSSDDIADAVATMQEGDVLLWRAHYAGPMPAQGQIWNESERHSSHFYLIKGYTDETWF